MKRILILLLAATLAGCVGEEDSAGTGTSSLLPGAYQIFTSENPVWSVQNGSATVLLLDENQNRLGSLFLDNTTTVTIDVLSGPHTSITAIVSGGEVFVAKILGAYPAPAQFKSIPLVIQEGIIAQVTEQLLPPIGLEQHPVNLRENQSLPFAPTTLRPLVSGAYSNLHVRISSDRGLLFEGFEAGNSNFNIGPSQARQIDGEFFPGAIGGKNLDIEVSADSLEGTLILQAVGYTIGNVPLITGDAINAADVSFKFGQLQAPSRVDLHPEAQFLYLQTEADAKVLVFSPEGRGSMQQFNGTLRIPAAYPFYGLVPVEGTVSVGTDRVPNDFEMRTLATDITRFSNDLQTGQRYETTSQNVSLPGIPYAVYPELEAQSIGLSCFDEGTLSIEGSGEHAGVTYAYISSDLGWGGKGITLWDGGEATLVVGQSRNPCDTLHLEVLSFSF